MTKIGKFSKYFSLLLGKKKNIFVFLDDSEDLSFFLVDFNTKKKKKKKKKCLELSDSSRKVKIWVHTFEGRGGGPGPNIARWEITNK